jgi:PTH1 family peptidyl-tRNA hydrolase
MLLWVGLGNPEPGMAKNRHNIGFMAVDAIAGRYGFSAWRRRFRGLVAEGVIAGEKILALKPLTYMNSSGESVRDAAAFYKLPPCAITAFHDELDLVPGKLRVKHGGGSAGHNGLRSMDRQLGASDYWRVRLGIGHPGSKDRVLPYVLGDFSKQDTAWLLPFLEAIADSAPLLAQGKAPDFMTRLAMLTQPPQNGVQDP